MEIAVPVALGAAIALVVLVVAAAVLLVGRSRARSELRAARSDTALLAARLDELAARVDAGRGPSVDGAEAAYVITDAGSERDEPAGQVSDRLVLSATLGEPLVRAVALGHGVRRALSAESRNRIRFEVRRETRRSRKQRRRDMRDAWRRERSAAAAAGAPTSPVSTVAPVSSGAA